MSSAGRLAGCLGAKAALACFLLAIPTAAQRRPAPPVTGGPPAGDWQSAGRDYALTRYSPLDQISTANVAQLRPVWSFSTGALRGHEGNPLVVGPLMFVHTPYPNAVYALDLSQAGAPVKWRYTAPAARARATQPGEPPRIPALPTGCCDVGSRGLAWHPSGKVYVPLLSGELAALDAATGREIWRVRNADPKLGATLAAAPLVVQDLVIAGVSGAEYGVRGYLTAYDALSGRLVWRGYSTGPDSDVLIDGAPNPNYVSHQGRDLGVSTWGGEGWRQGGGTASGWISYDPDLNLIYYGTDQPAPGNPAQRPGDNKWTSSILARDATTGKVRWAFQMTPHDEWGYGGSNENILVDLTIHGAPVKALVHFDRNGFAYTLDRGTGRVLVAERFGPANWARAVDLSSGLPQRDPQYAAPAPSAPPGAGAARRATARAGHGGHLSRKHRHQVPRAGGVLAAHQPVLPAAQQSLHGAQDQLGHLHPGEPYSGATIKMAAGPGGNRGRFIAWDAAAASIAWEVKEPLAVASGALTTAGGLVFYGTLDGWLKALDQRTGRELWRFKTPSGIIGSPIAFSGPDGKEYIAVVSGIGGWWGLGANGAFPDITSVSNPGGVLLVFAL